MESGGSIPGKPSLPACGPTGLLLACIMDAIENRKVHDIVHPATICCTVVPDDPRFLDYADAKGEVVVVFFCLKDAIGAGSFDNDN